jgi:hypothetical protein
MRYNCEFKNCKCYSYISDHTKRRICKCNHGKTWHNRKNILHTNSFVSPRQMARKPTYTYGITIFTPIVEAVPIVEGILECDLFCPRVADLPV